MTSVSVLAIGLGAGLVFAAWSCAKFVPLLRGQYQKGDNCTGSLIAIIGTLFVLVLMRLGGGSGLPRIIPIPGPGATPEPTPTEPPPVEPVPVEPIPIP